MAQVVHSSAPDSDVLVIRLQAGPENSWSDELRQMVAAFSRSHRRSAHLDLTELEVIDESTGASVIAGLRALAALRGGTVSIVGANPLVARALLL